jgi:signal transduction histidine kinase
MEKRKLDLLNFQLQNLDLFILNRYIALFLISITLCIIIIIIVLDVKYRKRISALIYREALINLIYSNVNVVFSIYDLQSRCIEYISPNFERFFGIRNEVFQKVYLQLLGNIPAEYHKDIIRFFTCPNISENADITFQYQHPITNEMLWLSVHLYPSEVLNMKKKIICYISDITKETQANIALKSALSNIEKANEAKKDFLSHISHELKTPIHSVIGLTQLARNSLGNPSKQIYYFDRIHQSSYNLLDIINNILDVSKMDSDNLVLLMEPFYLSNLLQHISSIISTQAELNHQYFELILNDIQDDSIIGDSLRLTQILNNCISNALKFTPSGGKITLEVSEMEKYKTKALYRFVIKDTGKGMSDEYIKRIFLPFNQEDSSIAKKYGGTGLGMFIVKNLVHLMGGSIHVASKVGIGTTITIDIMLELNETSSKMQSIEISENEELPSDNRLNYDFSGKRILVVEDNAINLEIICDFLKYVNIAFDTAVDGFEAISKFESAATNYYDIIIMDIQLPDLNGYQTAKTIRTSGHSNYDSICIIALTADSTDVDYSLYQEYGMNYYITKPIDRNKFYHLLYSIFNL